MFVHACQLCPSDLIGADVVAVTDLASSYHRVLYAGRRSVNGRMPGVGAAEFRLLLVGVDPSSPAEVDGVAAMVRAVKGRVNSDPVG